MRGGTPGDWMEWGKHGPEDLDALLRAIGVGATARLVVYSGKALRRVERMQTLFPVLVVLYTVISLVGAGVVACSVEPHELPTTLGGFGVIASAGGVIIRGLGSYLDRVESRTLLVLQVAMRHGDR